MDQNRPRPPILDMTPEGEFRDPPQATRAAWLDRALGRVGGVALLLTLAAGGLLVVAMALVFIGLLLPVAIAAGAVAFGSLWWRLRRLRRSGGGPGRAAWAAEGPCASWWSGAEPAALPDRPQPPL